MIVYEITLGILLATIIQSVAASILTSFRKRKHVQLLRQRLAILEEVKRHAGTSE